MTHDRLIIGLVILALIATGLTDTLIKHRAWFRDQLLYAWAVCVAYVRDDTAAADLPRPPTVSDPEGATGVNAGPGPGWAEDDAETLTWMAALHQDPDLTQPFQAFRDPPAGSHVLVPVHDGHVSVTYEPPVDVPRPGPVEDPGVAAGPGYFPADVPRPGPGSLKQLRHPEDGLSGQDNGHGPGYLPHAGPPAWRPRHAKTSWVDELIAEALGAPTVEIYMWNWQQRHRLAVTA